MNGRLAASTVGLALLLFAASACGGGDSGKASPGVNPSAVGTQAPTSGVPGSTAAPEAPPPAEPKLADSLRKIGAGEFTRTIDTSQTYGFDPLSLPLDPGEDTPPCSSLGVTLTWQVIEPYPAEGVNLTWQLSRMGGPIAIARGPAGSTVVGCGLVELLNSSLTPITVHVRYAIGRPAVERTP
jgi:hypothetical protein